MEARAGIEAECDYVIVGGGSAGCLAAWRLVQETGCRVVLLELGQEYRGPYLKLTPGYSRLIPKGRHCTLHHTVPQRHADNRELEVATGRVLGGGSSVNAQVYMRGNASDYDQWGRDLGSDLWSWKALLPHFRRLEGNQKFNDEFHNGDGPLKVADPGFVCEYSHQFVKAAQSLGLPFTADFNRGAPRGTGYLQITSLGGRRCSAVDAYLDLVRANERLRVITDARASRILMERDRAVGVEYRVGSERRVIRCNREVLVASGAFGSPQLLMLSGIGPADHLQELGIPVVIDLPGVGQNLRDHCGAPIVLQGNERGAGYGYFRQSRGWRLALNLLEYGLFRGGRMTSVGGEATSFHVGDDGTGESTVQVWCVPSIEYANTGADSIPAVNGLKLHVTLNRPRSVGTLKLRSADPADRPLVDPNYLADPRDLTQIIEGLRTARTIAAAAPLSRYIERELQPGPATQDTEAWAAYVRRTVRTDWHPVGTCRMGRAGDRLGVVDATLKVFGTQGLRVIDASIMPGIVSANTNAPTMAIADRGMSLLLGEAAAESPFEPGSITPTAA